MGKDDKTVVANKEEEEIVTINKWDGAAVKNAIDDAIREILTVDLDCKESFALMDGRLFLCGLAVSVAIYALLWDFLYPFPQSRLVLIVCASSYFILMGILTLYTTFKEKGIFVVAKDKKGKVWEASSYVKSRYDDKYNLVLSVYDPSTKKHRDANFNKSFANFVDDNGLVLRPLIKSEVMKVWNSLSADKKEKVPCV